MRQTPELRPADFGSVSTPVTYSAYLDEAVVISGASHCLFVWTSTFGVDGFTLECTYTLIAGTLAISGFEGFGSANAFNLGGGVIAYFQEGSHQLVVVPETSVFARLAGALATWISHDTSPPFFLGDWSKNGM